MLSWLKGLLDKAPPQDLARLDENHLELLGECWNDLESLAEAGSGFDPDWETKTAW